MVKIQKSKLAKRVILFNKLAIQKDSSGFIIYLI